VQQALVNLSWIINLVLPHLIKKGGSTNAQNLCRNLAIPIMLFKTFKKDSFLCFGQGRG
jgi:hypothetical protein